MRREWPPIYLAFGLLLAAFVLFHFLAATVCFDQVSMMATNPSPTKGRDRILSLLDAAIEALNLAKEVSSHTPAKAIFGAAGVLLAMIRVCSHHSTVTNFWPMSIQDSMVNKQDYVELGLSCARVCKALDRGLKEGRTDELSEPVLEAIGELTT